MSAVAGRSPAFNQRGTGTCTHCGKVNYRSRKEARGARSTIHPGEKMSVYECIGGAWHMGHDRRWLGAWPVSLTWSPLPAMARAQVHALARMTIGATA